MVEKVNALKNSMHFEPLTELALQRYTLTFKNGDVALEGISPEAVKDIDFLIELSTFYSNPDQECLEKFDGYSLSVILDYLKRTHRLYSTRLLPKMEMAIKSLKSIFPEDPITIVLDHFYRNYQDELLEHIEFEESRLFPYAEQLYDGKTGIDYSVREFKMQHNHDIEDHLEDMLIVIEDEFSYVAETFAYRSFKNLLDHFRADLHIHHLIEEYVFLKKVEKLEETIKP